MSEKLNINYRDFGRIEVNGVHYSHDIVIDRGQVARRDKSPSKKLKQQYAHTPLSVDENIPWDCRTLIIGIGMYGSLPVTDEVRREAEKRNVILKVLKTGEACELLRLNPDNSNAILHLTC